MQITPPMMGLGMPAGVPKLASGPVDRILEQDRDFRLSNQAKGFLQLS
jgi:hypothetical protein